jgi:hypothetical protein
MCRTATFPVIWFGLLNIIKAFKKTEYIHIAVPCLKRKRPRGTHTSRKERSVRPVGTSFAVWVAKVSWFPCVNAAIPITACMGLLYASFRFLSIFIFIYFSLAIFGGVGYKWGRKE